MYEKCPVCNTPIQPGDTSCTACGFKLSGSTQRINPVAFQDGQQHVAQPVQRPIKDASLTVVRGEQINTRYDLEQRPMTIGRAPSNDIFLNDMTVSGTHARIFVEGGRYHITDTGSFNGVWINNESVNEAVLHDGDIVQIGVFCLLFQQ